MKNNIYTDRFETVIPDALRRRYRVPRGTILNEVPKYVAPPAPSKTPSPWIVAGVSVIFLGVASLAPIMAYLADAKDKAETIRSAPIASTPAYIPAPTLLPPKQVVQPEPTPFPQNELDQAVHALATPVPTLYPFEVRRAQLVNTMIGQYFQVTMPYGGQQRIKLIGQVTTQEQLPLSGNTIGDAYAIGPEVFVWVAPGGIKQWIDPCLTLNSQ